eukprot:1667611-Prymnesium_polylepis.1
MPVMSVYLVAQRQISAPAHVHFVHRASASLYAGRRAVLTASWARSVWKARCCPHRALPERI